MDAAVEHDRIPGPKGADHSSSQYAACAHPVTSARHPRTSPTASTRQAAGACRDGPYGRASWAWLGPASYEGSGHAARATTTKVMTLAASVPGEGDDEEPRIGPSKGGPERRLLIFAP